MNYLTNPFLLPFFVAFLLPAVLTPLFIPILKRIKLMDDPKVHRHPAIVHKKPIPRGGGLLLFLGALTAGFFFLPHTRLALGILSSCTLMLIVGLLDDWYNARGKDLSPLIRFGFQIVSAGIVVASGVSIHFVTNPLGGILHLDTFNLLADLISILWLTWVMNMINWSKGVDGQMPGIVAIAAIIIGIVGFRLNPVDTSFIDTKLSFIIAGSALGFLLYNFYPAKIFPGFSATSLYLLLGVASILSSAKLATAILVLGVPTVDAAFIIVRRILARKNPFKGDKNHLHHILLRLGYSQRQIALFYWILSAILGVVSLTLASKSKEFALLTLVVIVAGGLLFLHAVTRKDNEEIIA